MNLNAIDIFYLSTEKLSAKKQRRELCMDLRCASPCCEATRFFVVRRSHPSPKLLTTHHEHRPCRSSRVSNSLHRHQFDCRHFRLGQTSLWNGTTDHRHVESNEFLVLYDCSLHLRSVNDVSRIGSIRTTVASEVSSPRVARIFRHVGSSNQGEARAAFKNEHLLISIQ